MLFRSVTMQKLWAQNKPPSMLNDALADARRHVPHSVSFQGTKLVIRGSRNHPSNWLAQTHKDMLI